jgi:tetratricopeptide (TPR) repeat protein
MADLIANAPSSLSDDEIEALLAMLEKVSPSPSIEIDFFDETGVIAMVAGAVLGIVVFMATFSSGIVFFFGMSRQPFFRMKFVNGKVNTAILQAFCFIIAPSFGILSTTTISRIDALWGGEANVWHVRRWMGGIQLTYTLSFIIYFLHYTYMQRFPKLIRNIGAGCGVLGFALGWGLFVPLRSYTSAGEVGAGLMVMWALWGGMSYYWFYNFDQKLENNYEYSLQVKETRRYLMAGDHPEVNHNHVTTFVSPTEEVKDDGYSRFHLEREPDGAWCISVSESERWFYCNDDLGEDKLIYTADGDEWDDDHMRFYFEQQKDLGFRIRCKASNRYFHCDELGDRLLSTRTQSYDDTTIFYLTRHMLHGNWSEDWVTVRELILLTWYITLGVIPFSIVVASMWPEFAAGLGKTPQNINSVRQTLVAMFLFTFLLIGMYRLRRGKLEILVPFARDAIAWSFNICFALPAPLLALLIEIPAGAQFCSTFLGTYTIIMGWSFGWKQIRTLMLKEGQAKLGGGFRVKFLTGLTCFVFAFVAWPGGVLIGIFVGNYVAEKNYEGMYHNVFRGSEGMAAGRAFAVLGFGLIQAVWCVLFRKRALTLLNGYSKSGWKSFLKHGKLPYVFCIFCVWFIVLPVGTVWFGCFTDPYAESVVGTQDALEVAYIRENLAAILCFVISLLGYFEVHNSYLRAMLPTKIQIIAAVTFVVLFAGPAALLIRLHRSTVAVQILVSMLSVGVQGVIWFSRSSTRTGPALAYVVIKSVEFILLLAVPSSIMLGFFFSRIATADGFGSAVDTMVKYDGTGLGAVTTALVAGFFSMLWLIKTRGGYYEPDLESAYKKALEQARKKKQAEAAKGAKTTPLSSPTSNDGESKETSISAYVEEEDEIAESKENPELELLDIEDEINAEPEAEVMREDEIPISDESSKNKTKTAPVAKKKGKKKGSKEFKMSKWTLRFNSFLVHVLFIPSFALFAGSLWPDFAKAMFTESSASQGTYILGGLAWTFGMTVAFHFFYLIILVDYHIVSKLFMCTYFEVTFALSGGVVIAANKFPNLLLLFVPPFVHSSIVLLTLWNINRMKKNGTWFRNRRSDPISTKVIQNKFVYTGLLGVFTGAPFGLFCGYASKYIVSADNDATLGFQTLLKSEKLVLPYIWGSFPLGLFMILWIGNHVAWGARNFTQNILVVLFVMLPLCSIIYIMSEWFLQGMTGIGIGWNALGFNTFIFRGLAVVEEFGIIMLYAFKIYENSIRRFGGGLSIMGIMFASLFCIQGAAFYLFETLPLDSITNAKNITIYADPLAPHPCMNRTNSSNMTNATNATNWCPEITNLTSPSPSIFSPSPSSEFNASNISAPSPAPSSVEPIGNITTVYSVTYSTSVLGYLSLGVCVTLPWIFIFILSFVSWTINPRDKFMLSSILLWVIGGLVIPDPSPVTGTRIEEDILLMFIAAAAVLIVFALILSSLTRQFAKQQTMVVISFFWFFVFIPVLAGVPYYLLGATGQLFQRVVYATGASVATAVLILLLTVIKICCRCLLACTRKWKKDIKPTVVQNRKTDPKSLENKAGWIFYIGISFSVICMLFSYHRIAIPKRKNLILSTMCCVPVIVTVLVSKRLHTRCKGMINIAVLVVIPLMATVPLLYFYSHDERVQSFCLMIVILFPASAGILAFMQGSRIVVSGFGDRIEGLITGVNAACCWCLLIPFGVALPTVMSLPWQTDQFSASLFGTVIGGLAMVAVVFVAITAMGINATFLGMKREKIAKIGTGKLKKAMKRMKIEVSNDVGRNIFDKTCSAGASVTDDHLHDAIINNEFANYVVDVNRKKPKSTLWEQAELMAQAKKGKVRMCIRCQEFGFNVLTAKGNRNFCSRCQLEDIALKEKEKIQKEKALANASAEERALAKKMERMGEEERLRKAKEAHEAATAAIQNKEWDAAIEKSNLAIQLYQEETIMELYEVRCKASTELGQFADANADITLLLRAYPKVGKHHVSQGQIYVGLERKQEAVDAYEEALRLEPERDELEAVIKELKLQMAEDSGQSLGDVIAFAINQKIHAFKKWKARKKQQIKDFKQGVKNGFKKFGKNASRLIKKHCGVFGRMHAEFILLYEDFQADWKGFLMGQSKAKVERMQKRQMFLNYHASKIQIKWRKKIYERQKQKKSSEKSVLQTSFLTYARGGLSIENCQRITKWRVGNHVRALWEDDDEYYDGIIQKIHAKGFVVFFTAYGDANIVRPQHIKPPEDPSVNAVSNNMNPLVRQDQSRKMILNLLRMSPRDFKQFVIESGMPMNAAGPAFRQAMKWEMKRQKQDPFHQMSLLKSQGKKKRPSASQLLTIQGFTKAIEELAKGLYPGTARAVGIKWIITKHVKQNNPLFDEQRKRAVNLQKARLTEMLSRLSGLDAGKRILTRNDYARIIQRCWLNYKERQRIREKMAALMLQMLIRRWVIRRKRRKKQALAKMNALMAGDGDSDDDVEIEEEGGGGGGGISMLGIDDDDDDIESSEDEEEEEEVEEEDLSKYDEEERIEIIIQRAVDARAIRPTWGKVAEALEPAIIKVKEIVNKPSTLDEDIIVDWSNSGNITACVQVLQDFYLFTSVALRTSGIAPFREPVGGCQAMAEENSVDAPFRMLSGTNGSSNISFTPSPSPSSSSAFSPSPSGGEAAAAGGDYGICTILMILDIPKFDFSVQFPDSYMVVFWTACFIACIFPVYSYKSIQMAKAGTLGMNSDGSKVSSCSLLGLYFTGLSVFSTTLYFGIVKTMLSAFACDWSDISDRVFLLASEDIVCFSTEQPLHIIMCVGGIAAIMLYYPLATLLQPQFQFKDKSLDIKYDPSYLILYGQGELLFAGATVFFGGDEGNIAFMLVIILTILCLALAWLTHSMQPCMVPEVNRWRTAVFVACAFSGAGSLYYMYTDNILLGYVIIFSGWGGCIFAASGGEARHQIKKKREKQKKKELLGEKHQAEIRRKAFLKRIAIEDNKILKGNADFGASGGFWYWGGGLEADVVEDGTADFGSEAGFYYWGPKHYVKPVEDEPEKGKKDKRKKKKRRNRKIIIEDIDDDDLLAARKGRKTPRKTPRNDKTPRSGKTPRKTPKSTPRKTHQNTPRNTPRKTPREEREARRQRQKDIANLGDAEFEAEIIRQRAEKRKKRHLKQRMAATSGD